MLSIWKVVKVFIGKLGVYPQDFPGSTTKAHHLRQSAVEYPVEGFVDVCLGYTFLNH